MHYGEWMMDQAPITKAEYEKYAVQCNSTDFDANSWATMAREAGMM